MEKHETNYVSRSNENYNFVQYELFLLFNFKSWKTSYYPIFFFYLLTLLHVFLNNMMKNLLHAYQSFCYCVTKNKNTKVAFLHFQYVLYFEYVRKYFFLFQNRYFERNMVEIYFFIPEKSFCYCVTENCNKKK